MNFIKFTCPDLNRKWNANKDSGIGGWDKLFKLPKWKNGDKLHHNDVYEFMCDENHKVNCVLTGEVNNITVFDFDVGDEYYKCIEQYPELKDAYTIKTTKGFHIYCKYNPDYKTTANKQIGIDIRNDSAFVFGEGTKTEFETSYDYYCGDKIDIEMPYEFYKLIVPKDIFKSKPNKKEKNMCKPLPSSNTDEVPIDDKILLKYCECIDINDIDDINAWMKLVWSLHGHKEVAYELSRMGNNFEEEAFEKMYKSYKEKGLTIKTFYEFAKKGNRDKYFDILNSDPNKKEIEEEKIVKPAGENNYTNLKNDFEKTHAKIINLSCFSMIVGSKVLFKTKAELITSYEHLSYMKYIDKGEFGYYKKECFITEWVRDENMRLYQDIDVYPIKGKCPENILNTWIGFNVESEIFNECQVNNNYIETFKKHILILCNNDVVQQEIVLQWVAHMFQYPDKKSFNPVFISIQGVGKGTFMKILRRLIGDAMVIETADPLNQIFGKFNDRRKDAFLININECKKKDMLEVYSQVLEAIVDPIVNIHPKGGKPYEKKSFERFITFSNNEDPMPVQKEDRRNHIIECSSEKVGDMEYFANMNNLIDSDEFIYSIYNYLINLKNVPEKFNVAKFPKTEYHQILQESSRDYADLWLENFTKEEFDNPEKPTVVKKTSTEIYSNYRSFIKENNIKCERNCISFMKHLSCLKLDGITSCKGTGGLRMKQFDLVILGKKYCVGCQLPKED